MVILSPSYSQNKLLEYKFKKKKIQLNAHLLTCFEANYFSFMLTKFVTLDNGTVK